MQTNTEPRDASKPCCLNLACPARGQQELGTIVIHDRKRQRSRCKVCKRTFSARRGTMFEGLRKPVDLIVIVVTLLCYGCPVQAIVHALGVDERTVAHGRDRAGAHCQNVHQAIVEQGQRDLMQGPPDAHSCQRVQNDGVDGTGHDGLDALVAGWGGPVLA